MKDIVERLRSRHDIGLHSILTEAADTIERLRAAQQGEPVAWIDGPHGVIRANPAVRFSGPTTLNWSIIPLYAAPQQRQPLSDEQIEAVFGAIADTPRGHWLRESAIEIVRKTERAHGIGEKQ